MDCPQHSLAHCFVFVNKKDHMVPCKESHHIERLSFLAKDFEKQQKPEKVVNLQSKAGADGKKVAHTL